MKKLLSVFMVLALSLSLGYGMVAASGQVLAATNKDAVCKGIGATGGDCDATGTDSAETKANNLVADIINIFSWVVGVVAVIMVIFGGFRYITSGGDSGKISSAKNTIIYALIGLVIVALAQVIVIFVLNAATKAAP